MTPNRASPHRKPAGRRRQPDYTLVRSILRPGPPIAPTSTDRGARDRTLRHACRDRSANQAVVRLHLIAPLCRPPTVGNRQIPIDPKPSPAPAGSFPGGFRTPTLGAARYVSTGRHPKPFTSLGAARYVSTGRHPKPFTRADVSTADRREPLAAVESAREPFRATTSPDFMRRYLGT